VRKNETERLFARSRISSSVPYLIGAFTSVRNSESEVPATFPIASSAIASVSTHPESVELMNDDALGCAGAGVISGVGAVVTNRESSVG